MSLIVCFRCHNVFIDFNLSCFACALTLELKNPILGSSSGRALFTKNIPFITNEWNNSAFSSESKGPSLPTLNDLSFYGTALHFIAVRYYLIMPLMWSLMPTISFPLSVQSSFIPKQAWIFPHLTIADPSLQQFDSHYSTKWSLTLGSTWLTFTSSTCQVNACCFLLIILLAMQMS